MLEVPLESGLHLWRFYPPRAGASDELDDRRQTLIIHLAQLHLQVTASGAPRAFCEIELSLSQLAAFVRDYRPAFDHFFEVKKLGYSFRGGEHSISRVIPRKVKLSAQDRELVLTVPYVPPPLPDDGEVSKVWLRPGLDHGMLKRLMEKGRPDLVAPVRWLLSRPTPEITFFFSPSGQLQQRDTSTWPIRAIETWPRWLREELFGEGVDIDSAYTQFLLKHLSRSYDETHLKLYFPDLVRLVREKTAMRAELSQHLGLNSSDEHQKLLKQVLMGLANGARISPGILLNDAPSSIADVLRSRLDITATEAVSIGTRLNIIARQFAHARRVLCTQKLGMSATRRNQKRVFQTYFEWERAARYAIWKAVGQVGIMMHDGVDGIPPDILANLDVISDEVGLQLSI